MVLPYTAKIGLGASDPGKKYCMNYGQFNTINEDELMGPSEVRHWSDR